MSPKASNISYLDLYRKGLLTPGLECHSQPIHSFNKDLLSAYCVSGALLGIHSELYGQSSLTQGTYGPGKGGESRK